MKKLFALVAAATCGAELAVESANIVGYAAVSDEGNKSPGIGAVFCPMGLGETYKLSNIVVSGVDADEFMNPGTEYLQKLNPATTAVAARYTYVSEAFLKDEFEDDWEDYKDAIGWWSYVAGTNYGTLIETSDFSLKCGTVKLAPGFSFLGALKGNGLVFKFPAAVK